MREGGREGGGCRGATHCSRQRTPEIRVNRSASYARQLSEQWVCEKDVVGVLCESGSRESNMSDEGCERHAVEAA